MHRKVRNYSLLSGFDYYTPGWGGMAGIAGLLVVGTLIGGLVLILLKKLMPAEAADTYGLLVTYPLMFIPAMIFASVKSRGNAAYVERNPLNDSRYGRIGFWPLALLVAAATLAAAYLSDAITEFLPPMPYSLRQVFQDMTGGPLWVALLSVSVMAPFFEEWLCRGEIMRGLLGKVKPAWAIVLSALFFAIIHMNPWQAIPAFLLGCLFGYVYYKTGSLLLTMVMHCANNTFSVICTRIDKLGEADTWLDVLTPSQYIAGAVLAAIVVALTVYVFQKYTGVRNR